MAGKKRIGILTGGGDVPGLNSVIKSLVYRSTETTGYEVIGIRRGWEGLTHLKLVKGADPNYIVPLDRNNTRIVDRTGGTFLHTSRTNPAKMSGKDLPPAVRRRSGKLKQIDKDLFDTTELVLDNLQKLKLDYLVAIGGDDTISYAHMLHQKQVPVIAVPKTMDNDVQGTEYCIGFSTAMTRAVESLTRLRTTLGSHERIGVFRIFGRDAGFTALYTAYVASVRCCIPEVKFNLKRLIDTLVADKRNNPSHYAIVLLSEGATWTGRSVQQYGPPDLYGHQKKVNIAESFAEKLEKASGDKTTVTDLTYELRSGEPDFLDKMVATTFATMAFECIASGAVGRMMAIRGGCYTDTDIPNPELGPRQIDADTMYNRERFRPDYATKKDQPIFMMRV